MHAVLATQYVQYTRTDLAERGVGEAGADAGDAAGQHAAQAVGLEAHAVHLRSSDSGSSSGGRSEARGQPAKFQGSGRCDFRQSRAVA